MNHLNALVDVDKFDVDLFNRYMKNKLFHLFLLICSLIVSWTLLRSNDVEKWDRVDLNEPEKDFVKLHIKDIEDPNNENDHLYEDVDLKKVINDIKEEVENIQCNLRDKQNYIESIKLYLSSNFNLTD